MKNFIVVVCLVLLCAAPVCAQNLEPVRALSPQAAALGGYHAAAPQGLDSIFSNPAGFASQDDELLVARLSANLSGPVFDIANAVFSGNSDMLALVAGLVDNKGRLFLRADIDGPLAFGYVGKGLGFGLFNRSVVALNARSLLSASLAMHEELLLTGGYAHRFELGAHNLDLGLSAKGFLRMGYAMSGTLNDLVTALGLVMAAPDLFDTSVPFQTATGLGIDVGVLWTAPFGLSVGFAARDAYTAALVTTYSSFKDFRDSPSTSKIGGPEASVASADLSLGLAYRFPFVFLSNLGTSLVLMLDYNDFLNLLAPIPRNPILNAGIGLEAVIMDVLTVRLGVKDALPALGFGLNLSVFKFSLSMYGRELGLDPGVRPVYNVLMSLDFSY